MQDFPEGCDAKREDQKTKSPIARGMSDELDGIRGEFAVKCAPAKGTEGQEAEKKNNRLAPLAV
jgi:hypothetical protein